MPLSKCPQCGSKIKKKEVRKDGLCPYCGYNLSDSNSPITGEDTHKNGAVRECMVENQQPWNLQIDYHTKKPKVQMTTSRGKSINDVFTDGMTKQYHLADGVYVFTISVKRRSYECLVLIAPGDEPVTIHCSWNRKMKITMEQSKYATKIAKNFAGIMLIFVICNL